MPQLQSLVELIQNAALDHRRWSAVLQGLTKLLGAQGASLVAQDSRTHRMDGAAFGDHEAALGNYSDYYGRINPVWPPTFKAAAGTVLIDREVVDGRSYERSEFFNDFSIPHHLNSAVAVKVLNTPYASAVVTLSRRSRKPAFGRTEGRSLTRLAPHLQNALAISRSLEEARSFAVGLAAALHLLPHGAMLVDGYSKLRFANAAAQKLLRQADGLRSDPDGLAAATHQATHLLRSRIASIARQRVPQRDLLLPQVWQEHPLRLQIAPCRPHAEEFDTWSLIAAPEAMVLVLVFEDAENKEPADAVLRRRFGLTQAEANLAVAIADGHSLKGFSEQQGIALTTAKTHLHRVFEKTETHRQVDLVRLLLVAVKPSEPQS